MNPMTTPDSHRLAFSIPQIQESIFRHGNLSLNDLAKASRVNRTWFQMVTPFLWENITTVIDLIQEWSEGFQSGIASQGQWTRALHTSSDHVLNWCSHHCTRLLTIDAGPLSEYWRDRNSLLKLISRNPELQVLRWSAEVFEDDCRFSDILPGLMTFGSKSLTTLVLKNIQVDGSVWKVLNHHSVTMNHLEISGCTFFSNTFFVPQQQPQQSRSNLKRLYFKKNKYHDEIKPGVVNSFLKFLESLTDLVEFAFSTNDLRLIQEIPRVLTRSDQDASSGDLRPRSLGLLDTLNFGFSENARDVPIESTRELLDALPYSLTNLTLTKFAFGAPADLAISNLVQRNQDRLTSIRFVHCEGTISNESWQIILTSCRHLEVIEVVSGGSMLDVEIGMKEPWVCLNLEYFGGVVSVGSRRSLGNNGSEDVNDGLLNDCEIYFSQLAALTKLKKLKTILVDTRDRQPGWGLERSEMENRFLSMWSRLQICTEMKDLDIGFLVPDMARIVLEIEKKSREMWGHEAKILIRKGMY